MATADCIFCSIIERKIPANLVLETKEIIAFRDINPAAPVHVLIVPKVHIAGVNDLLADNAALLATMILKAKEIACDLKIADSGFRLVINTGEMAGQSVHHLHLHLLGAREFSWPPG